MSDGRMDSFFELNVFDKIYNVRLAISKEKHKRLKDYGDCNLYIHLKTEEDTINSKVFEQFEEIYEDLRDKKEKKKKKYANLIFKVCIPVRNKNGGEAIEVYIRRTYDNNGKPDHKDLSLNFLIELIERLLDFMDYELGVNQPQTNNFSEGYAPKMMEGNVFDDDEEFEQEDKAELKETSIFNQNKKQVEEDFNQNNLFVEEKQGSKSIFDSEKENYEEEKDLKVGAVDNFTYEGQKTFGLVMEEGSSEEGEYKQEENNVFKSFNEDQGDNEEDNEDQRKQDLIDLSNRFDKDFSQKIDLTNKSIEIPDIDPDMGEDNSITKENTTEEEGKFEEETESDDDNFFKQNF